MNGLPFALAALRQPGSQSFGEALWSQAKARFESTVSDRKGVIKFRRVGEIAHAELIQPFERAGAALAANHYVHRKFLRVHSPSLSLLATR